MTRYRQRLPQLGQDIFLTDGGIETDLIFNQGLEIREFAAHTLLSDPVGRRAVRDYLRGFLALARDVGTGFVLDTQTWKAHRHWAESLGSRVEELRAAVIDNVELLSSLRDEFGESSHPVVLNGVVGPRGDGYDSNAVIGMEESADYHAEQIGWMAETELDMVTALTFTQSQEAAGLVLAAVSAGMPAVVSFTVETDGRLPTGQPLSEAVEAVDSLTGSQAAYFMINCAHPDHFFHVFDDGVWTRRVRGVRCNASRQSHAELDASETLDDGDPMELARLTVGLRRQLPWINVLGGCCGSDLRHWTEIALAATSGDAP